jgi:hypothetical protein
MHRELSDADYDKLIAFIFEAKDNGPHHAGMTYEDGMEAVIDVMEGNTTAEEATET